MRYAYLFCNRRGGRLQRHKIVGDAAAKASQHLFGRGLPELPNTTPHTLPRTYISIALLANNFDVLWVMRQVGHADSTMTMDVYAQLQQRAERRTARRSTHSCGARANAFTAPSKDAMTIATLVTHYSRTYRANGVPTAADGHGQHTSEPAGLSRRVELSVAT